ncbi:MAG: adenosylcobinamide-GDP ribazoletransferase [Candidatus Bathyarchaeia archaeon]
MLKEIKNLFSFLTSIPVAMDKDCLVDCARCMFLFPLVGAFVGLLAGLFAWVISWFLPSLVVGTLALAMLLLITGLHHMDGLLDFGDGVMAHGSAERKIEIMHDQFTGAGGLTLGIVTLLVTAFAIAELDAAVLVQSLVVAEALAKFAMVVATWAGKAGHKGMNSPFMDAMHGKGGSARLVVAFAFSFVVAVSLLWLAGLVCVFSAVIAGLVLVGVAHRHFNCVTGDVLGATNELVRMVVLVVLLAVIGWV